MSLRGHPFKPKMLTKIWNNRAQNPHAVFLQIVKHNNDKSRLVGQLCPVVNKISPIFSPCQGFPTLIDPTKEVVMNLDETPCLRGTYAWFSSFFFFYSDSHLKRESVSHGSSERNEMTWWTPLKLNKFAIFKMQQSTSAPTIYNRKNNFTKLKSCYCLILRFYKILWE